MYYKLKKEESNLNKIVYSTILLLLMSSTIIYSQTEKHIPPKPTEHMETTDDSYFPVSRESMKRSPAYNYSMNYVTTVQVNVDDNGDNIVGDAANEPSIAVDPNNPDRMAIGWRQFNTISSSFRQAGYAYTTDGGLTWTFPGVIEPGIFRSDPVLDSDVDGNFYYNSLTNSPEFLCDVFKSSDGGATWDNGVFAQGGDKQWMTIDKVEGAGLGHIYAFWTSSFSVCSPGFFTRSVDNGGSFEDCITIPNDPYWGTLDVGPESNLYVAGTIGFDFLVAKSTNAKNPSQIVSWDMTTIVDLDGQVAFGSGPNPGGLMGQTFIAVDKSGGVNNGNVYVLCAVERDSNSDPADIMFARSTDGGASFSSPIKINDDVNTSAYQWFGTMSVAPNGRIDVAWLDTRDNPGSYLSALYYSTSNDGGLTWSQNIKLSDSFDPHVGWPQQNKMGDYFDMVSDNNGARLAWAATFNDEQDVYYSYITEGVVPVELVSFTASSVTNAVTLNWSTATELNNHRFEIERRTETTNWSTIGFVNGKGTTTEPQDYSYTDNLSGIKSTKLFYRLKQIDFNGNYNYSEIVDVKVIPSEFSLSQNYPNPFNPTTNIKYSIAGAKSIFVALKIYDILGNKVATLVNENKEPGTYEVEFDGSGLTSGLYLYSLTAGNFSDTKKFILMK